MSMLMNIQIISGPESVAAVLTREGETLQVSLDVILQVPLTLHPGLAAKFTAEGPVLIPLDVLLQLLIQLLNVRSVHVKTDHDHGCCL